MASLNLSSPIQTFNVGTTTRVTGALCTVSSNGSIIFNKILHPSPSGSLYINLVAILQAGITLPTNSCTYEVTYNGSSIDSGTFTFIY